MGTIQKRKRSNGTSGFTASVRLKRDGRVYYSEAKTFDRKQAAAAWLEKREKELSRDGAVEEAKRPIATLANAIDRYAHLRQTGDKYLGWKWLPIVTTP